jgi:predicted DNA-binding protein
MSYMISFRRLSIRIPEDLTNELKSKVDKTGKTESKIVREALQEYLRC